MKQTLSLCVEQMQRVYANYNSTLLSFSGGPDSVVLFFLLLELQKIRLDFYFHAFYLNHNMAGNQEFGNKSQSFVAELCQKYSVPLYIKEIYLNELIKTNQSESSENLGRKSRYTYLKEIVRENNLQTISTAHHKDDLVETMLMRLFQGVSPASLVGIKENSKNILRPLLFISKQEILNLANEQNWSYLLDPSNHDTQYKRNNVRQNVIPFLEQYFPSFQDKLIQFGSLLEEQNQLIKEQLPQWNKQEGESSILLEVLANLPSVIIKESIKNEITYWDESQYLTTPKLKYLKDYVVKYREVHNGNKVLYSKKGIKITKTKDRLICKKEN